MGFIGAMFHQPKTQLSVDPAMRAYAHGITKEQMSQQEQLAQQLAAQGGIQNQSDVFKQQQALANQLGQQAQGQGPNPALAQLNQQTGNNISAQAALMAGQRGSGANAGLLARQAAQQGGNIQQQAVGQEATMQAQQQLAAQQQLQAQQQSMAGLASQQVGQQTGAQQFGTNAALQNEQMLFNATQGQNQNAVNAYQAQAGMGAGLLGGVGNAVGGAIAKAFSKGGEIPGKPKIPGDSEKNDTVPAMLTPKEIVLPLSVTQSSDAPEKAKEFVDGIKNKDSMDGFKKIHQDEHKTVLQHSNGHQIIIANKALGGEMKAQLDALPHYADGGDVEPEDEPEGVSDKLVDPIKSAMGAGESIGQNLEPFKEPFLQNLADNPGSPLLAGYKTLSNNDIIPQSSEDKAAVEKIAYNPDIPQNIPPQSQGKPQPNAFEKAYEAEQQAAKDKAKAYQAIDNQKLKYLQIAQDSMKNINDEASFNRSVQEEENDKLRQQLADGKIDPNHYWSNLGSGQKAANILGILISGIGAGLSGQKNMAMEVLNDHINKDIESQKLDLGKKENLLSMNMQKLKDMDSAVALTRAQQLDSMKLNLEKAQAESSSPLIKANLAQDLANLTYQREPLMQQVAMRQAVMRRMSSPGANDLHPAQLIGMTGAPAADQAKMAEEIASKENAGKLEDQMLSNFDNSVKQKQLGNITKHPLDAAGNLVKGVESDHSLENQVGLLLKGQMGMRATPDLIKDYFSRIKPDWTDSAARASEKRENLSQLIQSAKSTPHSDRWFGNAFGRTLDDFSQTGGSPMARMSPQQQAEIQWAKRNPQAPVSQTILRKVGLSQ